jgi:hypothetical protein
MTDLDEEFRSAINRARGTSGGFLGGLPVTISSRSSLGLFHPSSNRKQEVRYSRRNFFSAGSSDSTSLSSHYSNFTQLDNWQTADNNRSGEHDSNYERDLRDLASVYLYAKLELQLIKYSVPTW